jgi:poly-gamma-glutamate capsule biosynthesis protein CapA/YwtB (metallophosphatase superfamily)
VLVISCIVAPRYLGMRGRVQKIGAPVRSAVRLLAFGDVNLGRMVGQKIINGEIDFPFQKISFRPDSADIIFANLECQLSDQHGITQDPLHNLIFTGPPNGAESLVKFGFTHVSTANNHAFDYGKRALLETLGHLDDEDIGHVGTVRSGRTLYEPLMFEKNGIRFAFFAVTDLMNFKHGWHGYVATTDTNKLFPAIREAAASVDVVILSVHGGDEYSDRPSKKLTAFEEQAVNQGVAVVLGHHPHVPYGVEHFGNGYIFHSLGNFVFYQPQLYWTQLSFAAKITLTKDSSTTTVTSVECIPLQAGYQPSILSDSIALVKLKSRLQSLSNIPITLTSRGTIN